MTIPLSCPTCQGALSQTENSYRCHQCLSLFPVQDEVEAVAAIQSLTDVQITGFLNQREVSQANVAADIMVLPSAWGETWGLVLNEAMNFALPVAATDRVGGAVDLVREGENGYIVPNQSVGLLSRVLTRLVTDPDRRVAFGQRSAEIIRSWGLEETAAGIIAASRQLPTLGPG